eukprot:2940715-Amphidinium_carterae.1
MLSSYSLGVLVAQCVSLRGVYVRYLRHLEDTTKARRWCDNDDDNVLTMTQSVISLPHSSLGMAWLRQARVVCATSVPPKKHASVLV